MNIDKYKNKNGYYATDDGYLYETAADFIQEHILKFCACGAVDDNLKYVRDVLEYVNRVNSRQNGVDWDVTYNKWIEEGKVLFSNDGAKYFAFYVLDTQGLTEHGGSVPGWLTENGKELLQDLNELYEKPETKN